MSEEVKNPKTITAFKFEKKLYDDIKTYLENRPFAETDGILTSTFTDNYETTYMTEEGLQAVTDYIGKCPRREVKELVERMKTGGIEQYNLVPKEESEKEVRELVAGDIVSAPPHEYKMTVHSVENGKVKCDYFDKENKHHRVEYPIEDVVLRNP